MQIFELYFNPKNEEGKIIKAFTFDRGKSPVEKKLGNLYAVGEARSKDVKFLDRLAQSIKEKYYQPGLSTEKSFSETLKKANEFLSQEIKKENVDWLGNLSFAVFSLKNSELIFTKTGNLKVLLLRQGRITSIGESLEKEDKDSYPLKIFFNFITGKIAPKDTLIILSRDVYNFLKEQGVLIKIAKAQECDEKTIKETFPANLFTKGKGASISGACLIFAFGEEEQAKPAKTAEKPKEKPMPALAPKLPKVSLNPPKIKKELIIPSLIVLLLIFGFLIFRDTEKPKELRPITEEEEIITEEKELFGLEKAEYIEPDKIFSFKQDVEKIIILDSDVLGYSTSIGYSPNSNTIYKQDQEIKLQHNFISADSGGSTVFFLSAGGFFSLNQQEKITLNQNFNIIKFYGANLYFLDIKSCEILRYSTSNREIINWLKEKKQGQECRSIAIDGSIWMLGNNTLNSYFDGLYQKSIEIPEGVTGLKTGFNLDYFYLLYPEGQRIILFDKQGELALQLKSESFDNLKDIAISRDGKTIWILNGKDVYRTEVQKFLP